MPSASFDNPEFDRLRQGAPAVDLARVALEIARDAYPELAIEPYLERIDALADRVRGRCPPGAGLRALLGQINWVLFVEEQFRGNTDDYYDPRNSYLNEVLDRRTGIPISLSVLYQAIAGRLGLAMAGLNLPAHFMLRADKGGETIIVDPFDGGTLLDREGCARRLGEAVGRPVALTDAQLAPCPPRLVVARMLRNLKAIYLNAQDPASALPVLRRLTALDPDDPIERRDLGTACLQADLPGEAIGHLDAYLRARPEADDVVLVQSLLAAARRDLAMRN